MRFYSKPNFLAYICGIFANYFNDTIFESGIINKKERDKMTQLSRKKCHTPVRGEIKSYHYGFYNQVLSG